MADDGKRFHALDVGWENLFSLDRGEVQERGGGRVESDRRVADFSPKALLGLLNTEIPC